MSPDALAIAELHAEVHTGRRFTKASEGWAWASLWRNLPLEYWEWRMPERLERTRLEKWTVYGSSGRAALATPRHMIAGPTLIVVRSAKAPLVPYRYSNEDCWPIDTGLLYQTESA